MALVASGGLLLSPRAAHPADSEPPPYPKAVTPKPASDNDAGFKKIFDGKTLQGWDGDSAYWRVEGGAIVGETKKKTPSSSFIIWQGGKPADFELKLEYRISPGGNSGVQYRSAQVHGQDIKTHIRGYQADIDGPAAGETLYKEFSQPRGLNFKRLTGQIYDEWGRTFLALPGQLTYVGDGTGQQVLASLADPDTLAHALSEDWNKLHLIVRGNQLIHIVNGHVMAMAIDDDTANRHTDGVLALQVHGGDPMKVEFRNIRLKTL